MTIKRVGSFSVGDLIPTVATALAAAEGDMEGTLAGALASSLQVTVDPPTITGAIQAAGQILGELEASVSLGPAAFGFSAQMQLDLIAELTIALKIIADLTIAFGSAGIELYTYTGMASQFGPAVSSETSSGLPGGQPNDIVNALVLATRFPTAFAALIKVIGAAA